MVPMMVISRLINPGSDTDSPFEYTLYDGASATIIAGPQPTAIFDNLGPGTYQVGSYLIEDARIDQETFLLLSLVLY